MRILWIGVVILVVSVCASALIPQPHVVAGMRSHEADLPPLRQRSVEELRLMNEAELQWEAASACDYAKRAANFADRASNDGRIEDSLNDRQAFVDTEKYLDRIRLLLREKTGGMPEWYRTLVAESWRQESPRRCLDAIKSR
jgi:hypothetical protein